MGSSTVTNVDKIIKSQKNLVEVLLMKHDSRESLQSKTNRKIAKIGK